MASFREKRTKGLDEDFTIEGIYKTLVEDQKLYREFCFQPDEKFQAYIRRETLRKIYEHGLEGLRENKEIAGALIGKYLSDNERKIEYVEIVHALSIQASSSSSIDVSVPPQEWVRISDYVDKSAKYRGEYTIIGWYHLHPNMKAFMSSIDQDTQSKHFSSKGNVAIVIALGREMQEVKCFDCMSSECPLYFLPEEGDSHLVVASLDKVERKIQKDFSNENRTIHEQEIEIQKLKVENKDLRNKLDQTPRSELYNRNKIADNSSVINNNSPEVNECGGLEIQNIHFWEKFFDNILGDFVKEERKNKYEEDKTIAFYPELGFGIRFHCGHPDIKYVIINSYQKMKFLSIDISRITDRKKINCVDEIRKLLSDARRNPIPLTNKNRMMMEKKIINAQDKCSKQIDYLRHCRNLIDGI